MKTRPLLLALATLVSAAALPAVADAEPVKLGFNYPKTGPYAVQGLDQLQAAQMAVEEINGAGGILGRQVELAIRDSQSKADVSTANATELIDKEKVTMLFGGSASNVAIAVGKVAQAKGVPFFGTLTYSTETTGEEGRRFVFRECYDSWMAAKALGPYLREKFKGKKYLYVTADYTWGWTTEDSVRRFSDTGDKEFHKGVKTPFPGATEEDFRKALTFAKLVKPDVLVLVLFGGDMVTAIRTATGMGLKKDMQIVVPNLTLGAAEGGGAKVMEGVIGALPWAWNIPYQYGYPRGIAFVEKFAARYHRYPCTSGASAYTIVYEYKAAVEQAKSFEGASVVKALEGREYQLLKDKQQWRAFDHQSVQTVYAVRCKPEAAVLKDKFRLDYFEILSSIPGAEAAKTREEWVAARAAVGKPAHLEKLPGE